MKEYMYNWDYHTRPSIIGKYDESGEWILPSTHELTPAMIAKVIAKRLGRFFKSDSIDASLRFIAAKEHELAQPRADFPRAAHYCSGCPHNSSTLVPEGSRALGGIGCHYMVTWMDRKTDTFTQMGGEGATWCGQAPFTDEQHVFQNLGDGTYFHSGSLAIRQAVAAKVNITYKILYNDAVAMTGGQPVDGTLTVPDIAKQVRAEGVQTIVVLSDDIEKWSDHSIFPNGVAFYDRDRLDEISKQLREVKGTSVLIFDQTCAAEKRRRRKRGKAVDPAKRTIINPAVCEGCGDCGEVSNCVSILPLETEFGRKREIDQSNCNKDFSCVKGFCPSFVTVKGGGLKKRKPNAQGFDFEALPDPVFKSELEQPWNILITGIGGTGVVTIGALLGMAAHLENKGGSVLDQTGLAQKGGAVTTHIRIAKTPDDIHAVRIAAGEADLVLGCDMVVVNDYWALSKIRGGRSHVVLNDYQAMPGTFTRNTDMQFPAKGIIEAIKTALNGQEPMQVSGTDLALALMGDALATNLLMLGFAWQQGLVPLSFESIMRAVELNGAAVEMNKKAFAWGRMTAHDMNAVVSAAGLNAAVNSQQFLADSAQATELAFVGEGKVSKTLEENILIRAKFLTEYQNSAYAKQYTDFVAKVRSTEQQHSHEFTGLAEAVAKYLFKLMAYKDEYEVARLYSSKAFLAQIENTFEGKVSIHMNLAPPLFAKKDANGHLIKQEFGAWALPAIKTLRHMKFLRGTAFDVFGKTEERKMERALIEDYKQSIETILPKLTVSNHVQAVQFARLPEHIRGFGHVKEKHVAKVKAQWAELMAKFG
jgi:indolepyruvate ferredoxin oxidoreductase